MAAFDGIDMRITAGGGAVVELSAVLGESPLEYAADPRGVQFEIADDILRIGPADRPAEKEFTAFEF